VFCMDLGKNSNCAVHNIKRFFYNKGGKCLLCGTHRVLIRGVSGGIVNILGGGNMDYSE
jgi:hypothetical protein